MQSTLRFLCRRDSSRRYSYKVTQFPAMPCPPLLPKAPRFEVAKDRRPQPEQVTSCDVRAIKKDLCATSERPKPPKEPREPFRSMWEITDQTNCKNLLPRFDTLFYHPRYGRRDFQRTWAECPPVRQRLRKVCCLDGIQPPEVKYRIKERCPDICGMDYKKLVALCSDEAEAQDPTKKCPKHYCPCCPQARCKPSCKIPREKTICERLHAPYPSFSERYRGGRPPPRVECRCLETVPRCLGMRVEIHRNFLDQSPTC